MVLCWEVVFEDIMKVLKAKNTRPVTELCFSLVDAKSTNDIGLLPSGLSARYEGSEGSLRSGQTLKCPLVAARHSSQAKEGNPQLLDGLAISLFKVVCLSVAAVEPPH